MAFAKYMELYIHKYNQYGKRGFYGIKINKTNRSTPAQASEDYFTSGSHANTLNSRHVLLNGHGNENRGPCKDFGTS